MKDTDWTMAIDRQRTALRHVVDGLFLLAGIGCGSIVNTLPREIRTRVLAVLRPAESALRRLLVAAAKNICVDLPPLKAPDGNPYATASPSRNESTGDGTVRFPSFPLLDPLKRFDFGPAYRRATVQPRIHSFDRPFLPTPARHEPAPEDDVDAGSLCMRLNRLHRALDAFDREALRMARLQARATRSRCQAAPRQRAPLRLGYAPGRRKRRTREIDDILFEARILARDAYRPPGHPPGFAT